MTTPLVILAVFAVGLGFFGTPVWPWFQSFLSGEPAAMHFGALAEPGPLMIASSIIVFIGLGLGWLLYGRKPLTDAHSPDVIEAAQPQLFRFLGNALYVDTLYKDTIVRCTALLASTAAWFDRWIWGGAVRAVSLSILLIAKVDRGVDAHVVNAGFDAGCTSISLGGRALSRLQAGKVQRYLKFVGLALVAAVVLLFWRAKA